jgi:hypothetical protein
MKHTNKGGNLIVRRSDMIITPNTVRDTINEKLDATFETAPEAEKDRNIFYHQLLKYFDEYGVVPDIKLKLKED